MSDLPGGACPINLDRRGVRQRALAGSCALAIGLGLGAWAVLAARGWPWRAAAFALFCFGALALLQARAKT